MTTKEIAAAVGKEVRAVQNWVKSVGAKNASINAKNASSNSSHPADYDIKEVCDIIEQGMGPDVAGTFRDNATTAAMVSAPKKPRLPSGSQINAMCWVYGKSEAAKRIDFAMGYKDAKPEPSPIYMIEARDLGRISKQAYAVEMRVRANNEAIYEQARLTPELGL